MYLLKLSLRPWKRSPYSQIFTSLAVGVLLFIGGFLFWMQQGLGPVIQHLKYEQVITAYLDPSVSAQNQTQIVDEIRQTVGAHPDVKLVQADEFIEHLRGEYPDLARELEGLGSEVQMIVPKYVSISGILPPNTIGEVRRIQGVQSAETSVDRFQNVIGAFRALQWIAFLLTAGLGVALATGLIHLARTNSFLHKDSSSLMQLMGASSGVLRTPGLVSGALVGLLGGIVAASGWLVIGVALTRHVRLLSPMLQYMPDSQPIYAVALIIGGLVMGACSGLSLQGRS